VTWKVIQEDLQPLEKAVQLLLDEAPPPEPTIT
jgi:hypothetical protein